MHYILFILIFFIHGFGSAQSGLKFEPVFDQVSVRMDERIERDGNWTEISALRFYISDLKVFSGKTIWTPPQKYFLLDLEDPSSFLLEGLPDDADSISFLIGIDSLTNVSGILDGALDPINGMYWAWNSGYINFKLEGKSSRSVNKDKGFEFHLGGYLPPFETVQHKTIYPESSDEIVVLIDLKAFLDLIDWSTEPNIMIPGPQAQQISQELPRIFRITP